VNEYFEIEGYPNVWALGDAAVVPDLSSGKLCPPTAQHALRQGKVLAHNIEVAIRGGSKKAFNFKQLGSLAAIGEEPAWRRSRVQVLRLRRLVSLADDLPEQAATI